MKIKSVIERTNGHTVNMEGESYSFLPPSYVCEVKDKLHADTFLGYPEAYVMADEEIEKIEEASVITGEAINNDSSDIAADAPIKSTPRRRRTTKKKVAVKQD